MDLKVVLYLCSDLNGLYLYKFPSIKEDRIFKMDFILLGRSFFEDLSPILRERTIFV